VFRHIPVAHQHVKLPQIPPVAPGLADEGRAHPHGPFQHGMAMCADDHVEFGAGLRQLEVLLIADVTERNQEFCLSNDLIQQPAALLDGVGETQSGHVLRERLHRGVFRCQADNGALGTVRQGQDGPGVHEALPVGLAIDVGRQYPELGHAHDAVEVVLAEIELVVAHTHEVQVHEVQAFHIRLALVDHGHGSALDYVPGFHEKCGVPVVTVPLLDSVRSRGNARDATHRPVAALHGLQVPVEVIEVQDGEVAVSP